MRHKGQYGPILGLVPRAVHRYKKSPLSYAIFEACFGEEPRREDWERAGLSHDKEAQRELPREDNPAKDKIVRCGMHVVRLCSFHLNNVAAADSPALCGELLSSMIADCFPYQVDVTGGDGNSCTYRVGGSKQQSSSNEQSLFQETFRSFRDAFVSCQGGDLAVSPKLTFTLGNTTEIFRHSEEHYGRPWNELEINHCPEDPSGDCVVACIIEWGQVRPSISGQVILQQSMNTL